MALLGGGVPPAADMAASQLLGAMNPQATKLTAEQEDAFRRWMTQIGHTPQAGYNVSQDFTGNDYDYRGFFQKHGPALLGSGEHLTDEYKLPSHKTFSNESVYFNDQTKPFAGRWEQRGKKWVFVPFEPRLKQQVEE
jgi:hypothetical protein